MVLLTSTMTAIHGSTTVSRALANGGYYMVTYPGAKGQDRYTITKVGEGRYHVDAQYGSSDGGFTLFPDQGFYGLTSVDVTL